MGASTASRLQRVQVSRDGEHDHWESSPFRIYWDAIRLISYLLTKTERNCSFWFSLRIKSQPYIVKYEKKQNLIMLLDNFDILFNSFIRSLLMPLPVLYKNRLCLLLKRPECGSQAKCHDKESFFILMKKNDDECILNWLILSPAYSYRTKKIFD